MSQPRFWKKLERHPQSAEYDDITGKAWEAFVENLKDVGILGKRKIITHESKVVDGWQLYRGCLEADIKPTFEELKLPRGVTLEQWVETMQDHRRHESQEAAMKRVADRRKRVTESRLNGQSIRTIAEQEGIGKTTVEEDLKASGVRGGTPEPETGKVTGRDGKTYEATKPPVVKLLCDRCVRIAPGVGITGCERCDDLRREAGQPKRSRRGENQDADMPSDDAPEKPKPLKSDLPKSVANALADTWHAECARLLSKMRKECRSAFSWSSWLDAAVLDHLKAAEECFITAVPKKVCPDCKGQKIIDKKACQTCRQGGYLAGQVA